MKTIAGAIPCSIVVWLIVQGCVTLPAALAALPFPTCPENAWGWWVVIMFWAASKKTIAGAMPCSIVV